MKKSVYTNIAEGKLLRAKKKYSHEKWIQRQAEYKKMIERDSYGLKSRKI